MKEGGHGYVFALPRLLARLAGLPVRRAEWSGLEVYGFGLFVFGFAAVVAGRALFLFVRPGLGRWLALLSLPLFIWLALLLLYYLNYLFAGFLRRVGCYSARTNNPLQHLAIMAVMTLLAVWLIGVSHGWVRSLGIFWLALVGLNLLALGLLRILHAP